MIEQFNSKQFVALGKQWTDTAFKAHGLAIAGFERSIELQLKHIEGQVNAAVDFFNDAVEARDVDSARALLPKTVALFKDSAEKTYATSQELMGLTVKTSEAIGDVLKASFEAANAPVLKPAARKAK
ncbi:MAG: phasin family protein [Xanthomonadaceae bacterium]|nr:phasin family protein [Xanthomonadaceae bacterium]